MPASPCVWSIMRAMCCVGHVVGIEGRGGSQTLALTLALARTLALALTLALAPALALTSRQAGRQAGKH